MTREAFERIRVGALSTMGADGELPYPVRRQLRKALANLYDDQQRAHLAWLDLEVASARRTLHVSQAAFPSESEPEDLMMISSQRLAANASLPDLPIRLGQLQSLLDDKFDLGGGFFAAIYAGFACWAAARDCLELGLSEDGESELEFGLEEWDAAFFASLAACGGATWEPGTADPKARRWFWEWYINDAIRDVVARAES